MLLVQALPTPLCSPVRTRAAGLLRDPGYQNSTPGLPGPPAASALHSSPTGAGRAGEETDTCWPAGRMDSPCCSPRPLVTRDLDADPVSTPSRRSCSFPLSLLDHLSFPPPLVPPHQRSVMEEGAPGLTHFHFLSQQNFIKDSSVLAISSVAPSSCSAVTGHQQPPFWSPLHPAQHDMFLT